MNLIRKYISSALLSYKALYGWMGIKTYLLLILLLPLCQTALFSYLNFFVKGIEGMRFAAVGNALHSACIFSIFYVGQSITKEKKMETLANIMITPTNKFSFFSSKIFFHFFEGLISSFIMISLSVLLFHVNYVGVRWHLVILIIIVSSLSMLGFGFLCGMICLFVRKATPVLNAIYLLLMLICGVNFPVSELPSFARYISNAIPLSYGIRLLHDEFNNKSFLPDNLILLAVTGAGFFILGYFVFNLGELLNRKIGKFYFY